MGFGLLEKKAHKSVNRRFGRCGGRRRAAKGRVTTLGGTDIFRLPEVLQDRKASTPMKPTTLILRAAALCVALGAAGAHGEVLTGIFPTCWGPWEVEPAHAAVKERSWDEFKKFHCGLLGDRGARVRVIRCAADVTDERMKHFSQPVPRDNSLPARVCEIEAFEDDGSSGIYYTYYFNIEKSL